MPAGPDKQLCYAVAAAIAAPADFAFDYLADPAKVGAWSLGSLNARRVGRSDAYAGISILDDSEALFRVDADRARRLIDYFVGVDADRLVMRISIRIVPGENFEYRAGTCLVTMTAWRPKSFDDLRWSRLRAFHDAEIHIIRAKVERAFSGRQAGQ